MNFVIGLVVGVLIGVIFFYRRPVGNLRIDRSDPSSAPYLFLELGTDVETVMHKKYVTLKVRVEDFLPHE